MRKENKLDKLLEDNEEIDLTLSYSRISSFSTNGPKALLERKILDGQGIKMGSLIDDMLFSPEQFKTKYYISSFDEPSSTLGVLAKIILDNYTEIPNVEEILKIIERSGLWKSTKQISVVKSKFDTDEFWGYLNEKYSTIDKQIVTISEKQRAEEIVSILYNHEYSKSIFDSKMNHIYQYVFEYKLKGFKLRGIIDILSIDHKNKKIYLKDLKTGAGSSSEFISSFIKYRYYLQEAVYSLAFDTICKNLNLEGYELQPFEFLYIGLTEKIPINFVVTEQWHKAALYGFKTPNSKFKGLYELIDEIYYHWKNKRYRLSKDVYESNGRINLQDNFIEIIGI